MDVTASLSSTLLVDRGRPAWFDRPPAVAVQPREPIPGQVMASVAIPGRKSRRAQQGPGEDLIRTLYEEHGRSLLAYAVRLTNDRAAAEDVVQETLLRAWKHADDMVNNKGSVRGWLLTVARNIITDRARARAVRPTEVAETPTTPPIQRDHAQGVVDSMAVLSALNTLS